MPQAPKLDGLPLWLQITLSAVFALVTLIIAFRGYQTGNKPNVIEAKTTIAHLADMSAVRALTDVCHQLTGEVVHLTRAIADMSHYIREQSELDREICARLRELREALEKSRGL